LDIDLVTEYETAK
jgi:hypothetical protein